MDHDPPLNYSGKLWRLGRICRDKRLSQAAIAVAAVLIEHADRYSGRCYPSVSRIVTESGLPRTNVLRALKALESTGWIIVERRTGATSTYSQPFGHGRQMNWAVSPNELGTSAEHLGSHSFVRRIT